MSRDLYHALFHPEEAAMISEDAEWLAAFSSAAAALRAWRAGSLAESELNDALYVDESADADLAQDATPLRLAAADATERDFPLRYTDITGTDWRLLLGLSAAGVPYALLEQAADAGLLTLHLPGERAPIPLLAGTRVDLPMLSEPPAQARLTTGDGREVLLRPEPDGG